MNEVNWLVSALVGAFIGFLLPYIFRIPRFLYRFFKPHMLERTWYHYYFQYQNDSIRFKEEVWKIKRGFVVPLKVVSTPKQLEDPSYKGSLHLKRIFS